MPATPATVLLTGASGFVGTAARQRLAAAGLDVRPTAHHRGDGAMPSLPLAAGTDWSGPLAGCDVVVHLAARTHVLREANGDPLAACRAVNTAGTLALARAAAAAGVRRFVFVSTATVFGRASRTPLDEDAEPAPATPYAVSKWEAEQALRLLQHDTGMAVTILRPPLVYGPGVGARFRQLLGWCRRGIPLPFAAVDNRRSLIGLANLADAITAASTHPAAAGRTYHLSDGEDVSTPELIRRLAAAMQRPARLLAVEPRLLDWLAGAVGKEAELERLLGSLALDAGRIRTELDWAPPLSLAAGLAETARWFMTR